MNIYIIGMPLAGKTTVANALAKKINYFHLDLDQYIEKTYSVSIATLFKTGNEITFRELETEALKTFNNLSGYVISAGGGIILNKEHKKIMKGPIVLLDIETSILEKRLQTSYQRPLLEIKSIEKLYNERKSLYYEFADIVIKSLDLNIIIEEIINKLKEKGYL